MLFNINYHIKQHFVIQYYGNSSFLHTVISVRQAQLDRSENRSKQ